MKNYLDIITSVDVLREAETTDNDGNKLSYNIENIRPNITQVKDMNEDEANFHLFDRGWNGDLSNWSKKEASKYYSKYLNDWDKPEFADAKAALESKISGKPRPIQKPEEDEDLSSLNNLDELEDTTEKKERKKKSPEERQKAMRELIQFVLSNDQSDADDIRSRIVKAIKERVRNIVHSNKYDTIEAPSNDLVKKTIYAAQTQVRDGDLTPDKIQKMQEAQGLLFAWCTPVIIKFYHKWKGKNDEATKPIDTYIGIAWDALVHLPSFKNRKVKEFSTKFDRDKGGKDIWIDTIDFETILKWDPKEIHNLDLSDITTENGALSGFDLDKAKNAQNLIAFFAGWYGWNLSTFTLKNNGLVRRNRMVKNPETGELEKKKVWVSKDGTVSDEISADTKDGEETVSRIDLKSSAIYNENGRMSDAEKDSLYLSSFEEVIRDNIDLFSSKTHRDAFISFLQNIPGATIENKKFGPALQSLLDAFDDNKELVKPLLYSDGINFAEKWMTQGTKDELKILPAIFAEYKQKESIKKMDSLLSRLAKLREMAQLSKTNKLEMANEKTSEKFLELFKAFLKKEKTSTQASTMWSPIEAGQSTSFKYLTYMDMLYIFFRDRSVGIDSKISSFVYTMKNYKWPKEKPPENFNDIQFISKYFVKMGYKISTAAGITALMSYFWRHHLGGVGLSIENCNSIDVDTAKQALDLIDEYRTVDKNSITLENKTSNVKSQTSNEPPKARDLRSLMTNISNTEKPKARDLSFLTGNTTSEEPPKARDLRSLMAKLSPQPNNEIPKVRDLESIFK
jgi:hypothetical protein